ncbi:ubinuclein-2 isoform X2 [Xenopus laevis]|uniref:Ubinuclein-2 isoform X2 n=1 Tax=Xenopus laevis TaxID=8355 RepID=A0A8J0V208_XENLA|nr:ubinuclein-2 isoform X2 [Xenopus laevis]
MAEPRRVPFVSLSPMKPRETGPVLTVEQQHQRTPPPLQPPAQRPPQPRASHQAMLQQRPPPQALEQRLQREPSTPALEADIGQALPKPLGDDSHELPGTVRLELALTDPTEEGCAEFSYPKLLQNEQKAGRARIPVPAKEVAGQSKPPPTHDPFNDDERERLEVENMAKKFEAKYGVKSHRHRKDRMEDLIDIGYGYDETDPFIDNSEAYDELVPASLNTKYGGFYINTGTLQFRQASDSENEDFVVKKKHKSSKVSKIKDDERSLKKRKRKEENTEKEKPKKIKAAKQIGVMAFNSHKPDKKKKKLYKDSLALAAMLRKFQKEKDGIHKKANKQNPPTVTVVNAAPKSVSAASTDLSDLGLGNDPVLAIFGSERELMQEAESALEMLSDFDFDKLLDSASNDSPAGSDLGENGSIGQSVNPPEVQLPKQVPPLPEGLPVPLEKRIADLRVAAKIFDEGGRKKFFTQEINNILLDIELQLQELSPGNRNGVYGHIETFVPCSKDALVKRLKKLHLHIQDDLLKVPLQRLKLAINNVMPGQINRYQEDCQAHNQAKNAKHQAEDDKDRNPSEEDDEEKPGKRVMGPRKKFCWDDALRELLCNLVRIKLGCYELEPNKSISAEDYLKTFMETEVKPLWPKGWMQSRMLFKESRKVHNHLTSAPAKKKVILAPKPKVKESSPKKEQKTSTPISSFARVPTPHTLTPVVGLSNSNCTPTSETICLDDSLDEDLSLKPPSLDSISDALAVLNNGASAPSSSSCIETPTSRPKVALREEKLASIMSKLPLGGTKKADQPSHASSLIAGHSAPVPKKPQDLAAAHSTVISGLIAGSSIQNPKVSLEPLPAKLLQQGMQRSLQAEVSSSTPVKVKASSAAVAKAVCSSSSTPSTSVISSSQAHVSSSSSQVQNVASMQIVKVNQQSPIQQNYVTPLQATISKSHTNPVVRLTSSPQISSTSPVIKIPEKNTGYRPPSSPSSSNQQAPGPRTIPLSTSSNFLVKNMGVQGSASGFKSPYTIAPSCKPTTSSSSSVVIVSQSTTHHKVPGGLNIGRSSPTVSPMPAGRGTVTTHLIKSPTVPSKFPNASPKPNSPSPRQPSPSSKMPAQPLKIPIALPKMQSPSPKQPNQSPKHLFPSTKPLNATPPGTVKSMPPGTVKITPPGTVKITPPGTVKITPPGTVKIMPPGTVKTTPPGTVKTTPPGTVKTTVANAVLNIPNSRIISNSSSINRTNLTPGAGNGTLGATKQPTPHRQPSASGSPVAAATVQSAAAASILANASPLTLMTSPLSVTNPSVTTASLGPFGMLGGLVPVTMPFQFPLELLSFGSDTPGVVTSPGSTSAAFHHNLTQNLLKGLQTTSPHTPTISHSSLPPHLQQQFTDFFLAERWR